MDNKLIRKNIEFGKEFLYEFEKLNKNGEELWCSINVAKNNDGFGLRYLEINNHSDINYFDNSISEHHTFPTVESLEIYLRNTYSLELNKFKLVKGLRVFPKNT
jgi:hypothetical protein